MKDDISIVIKKLSVQYDKLATATLNSYDLTASQFRIMKFLFRRENGAVTQHDIEKGLGMSNPTVTGVLQKLEKKEFITRQPNPEDARSKLVFLTDQAMKSKEEVLEIGAEVDRQLTKALTEDEKETVLSLLEKMLTTVEE